jgi:iron only hydrogenase large subunit-like protein/uncharacterized Fe-S cluster-containing protein
MTAAARQRAPIISTNRARCRDCYRCVRVCPVKAIRMHDGQAQVVEERCLYCGTCVRECPQKAKTIRDDTVWAAELLATRKRVAASVAPTYPAAFAEHEVQRLASALRKLGFAWVGETSVGAKAVAQATACHVAARQSAASTTITSACPAVVPYVESYAVDAASWLAPVVSPMIAHARWLRRRAGADAVIFIGPCVAKKFEAERPEYAGIVDCVLTFAELQAWLERESIAFDALEESRFDEAAPARARFFPLVGGQLRAADMPTDMLEPEIVATAGADNLQEVLGALPGPTPVVVEPLFCPGGCIGGPGFPCDGNIFERRLQVLTNARRTAAQSAPEPPPPTPDELQALTTRFAPQPVDRIMPSEDAIRRAMARIGKIDARDQLDCGACGYRSCREKAIAVVRGLAEPEMCMPRMRLLAERRTDRIIETSPNGIVILDGELRIMAMNPAFQRMFLCSVPPLGRHISYLTDPTAFEQVAANRSSRVERTAQDPRYGRIFHQIVYALEEDEQIVGIFVDVTESTLNREKLTSLHREAIARSRDLLEHQVRMAQDITRLLAEHTARGEELVKSLIDAAVIDPHQAGAAESAAGAKRDDDPVR